jgi:hypothetical protein
MSSRAYVGTAKRTFQQAVLHMLESDYGLLGSQRVLALLANDLQRLVDQFYRAYLKAGGAGESEQIIESSVDPGQP